MTGIEAYTTDYTISMTGFNVAPIVTVVSSDKNIHLKRRFLLEEKVIENERFDVDPAIQNKGHGLNVFAKQVYEAQKAGYKFISVIAAKNLPLVVGHYVWARMGFSPLNDQEQERISNHLKLVGFPGVETEPHKIVINPDQRKPWMEKGITFEGKFDLSDGSENIRALDSYKEEKGYEDAEKE